MAGNGGSRPGAGRPKGRRNQRTLDGETYARAIIEDPTVRSTFLKQAQAGELSADLVKTLLSYAFGKPVEVVDSGDSDTPRTIQITF
jgi:hypothetical protein